MERKHVLIFIVSILVVACVSSLCTAAIVNNSVNEKIHDAVKKEKDYYSDILSGIDSFLEVKDYVDNNFVGEADYEKIDELLANYYVDLIEDKYSDYYTTEEYKSYMNKLTASFVGIGIACGEKDGKIHIEEVIKGSPAEEAGLLAGENIVAVGDIEVNEENYDEATAAVSGEKGTKVLLKVEDSLGNVREIEVERREIVTETIYSEMLEGDIGYIKITQFSTNTADKFIKAVDELLASGAKGLLFDVRNNSGGELNSVVNILDRILPQGPIVNIEYGTGAVETITSTDDKKITLPMAVLINEKTASAAELFASALRDYNLASLYGTVTYGKGYMQRIVPLTNGAGLRLSIAKYNPPFGENYEGVGVSPDVEVEDDASTEIDEQFEKAKNYFIK